MNNVQKKIEEFFLPFPKKNYSKGDIVLTPEDDLSSLYYIEKGNIRMYSLSENGEITTITIFKEGSYFPIMLALSGQNNDYYFDALTHAICIKAPTSQVIEFLRSDTEVLFDLTTRFAGAIVGLSKRITDTSSKDLDQQIQSLLAYLYAKFDQDKNAADYIRIRHEDIANWLGVSRETVSRTLAKMNKK